MNVNTRDRNFESSFTHEEKKESPYDSLNENASSSISEISLFDNHKDRYRSSWDALSDFFNTNERPIIPVIQLREKRESIWNCLTKEQQERFETLFEESYNLVLGEHQIAFKLKNLLENLGYTNVGIDKTFAWLWGEKFFQKLLRDLKVPDHLITDDLFEEIRSFPEVIKLNFLHSTDRKIYLLTNPLFEALSKLSNLSKAEIASSCQSKWTPLSYFEEDTATITFKVHPIQNQKKQQRAFDLTLIFSTKTLPFRERGIGITFYSQSAHARSSRPIKIFDLLKCSRRTNSYSLWTFNHLFIGEFLTRRLDVSRFNGNNEGTLLYAVTCTVRGILPNDPTFFSRIYSTLQNEIWNGQEAPYFLNDLQEAADAFCQAKEITFFVAAFNLATLIDPILGEKAVTYLGSFSDSKSGENNYLLQKICQKSSQTSLASIQNLLLVLTYIGWETQKQVYRKEEENLLELRMSVPGLDLPFSLFIKNDVEKALKNLMDIQSWSFAEEWVNACQSDQTLEGLLLPPLSIDAIVQMHKHSDPIAQKLGSLLLYRWAFQYPKIASQMNLQIENQLSKEELCEQKIEEIIHNLDTQPSQKKEDCLVLVELVTLSFENGQANEKGLNRFISLLKEMSVSANPFTKQEKETLIPFIEKLIPLLFNHKNPFLKDFLQATALLKLDFPISTALIVPLTEGILDSFELKEESTVRSMIMLYEFLYEKADQKRRKKLDAKTCTLFARACIPYVNLHEMAFNYIQRLQRGDVVVKEMVEGLLNVGNFDLLKRVFQFAQGNLLTEEEASQVLMRILSTFNLSLDEAQFYKEHSDLIKKYIPKKVLNQKITKLIETFYQIPHQQNERKLALEILNKFPVQKEILTKALLSFSEACSSNEMEMIWNLHKKHEKDLSLETRYALLKKYLSKGLADTALLTHLNTGSFEFSSYYDQSSEKQSNATSLLFDNALNCLKLDKKMDLSFKDLMLFKNKYLNSRENRDWMQLWLEKTEGKDIELCLTMFNLYKLTANDLKPTLALLKAIEKGISKGVSNPKHSLLFMELLKNMKECDYPQEEKTSYKKALTIVLDTLLPLACLEAKKTKNASLAKAILSCYKTHQHLMFKEGKDHLYLEVLKCLPMLLAFSSPSEGDNIYSEWKQSLLTDPFDPASSLHKYSSKSLIFEKEIFYKLELTKAFLEIDLLDQSDEVLRGALNEIESLFLSLIDNVFKENENEETHVENFIEVFKMYVFNSVFSLKEADIGISAEHIKSVKDLNVKLRNVPLYGKFKYIDFEMLMIIFLNYEINNFFQIYTIEKNGIDFTEKLLQEKLIEAVNFLINTNNPGTLLTAMTIISKEKARLIKSPIPTLDIVSRIVKFEINDSRIEWYLEDQVICCINVFNWFINPLVGHQSPTVKNKAISIGKEIRNKALPRFVKMKNENPKLNNNQELNLNLTNLGNEVGLYIATV